MKNKEKRREQIVNAIERCAIDGGFKLTANKDTGLPAEIIVQDLLDEVRPFTVKFYGGIDDDLDVVDASTYADIRRCDEAYEKEQKTGE